MMFQKNCFKKYNLNKIVYICIVLFFSYLNFSTAVATNFFAGPLYKSGSSFSFTHPTFEKVTKNNNNLLYSYSKEHSVGLFVGWEKKHPYNDLGFILEFTYSYSKGNDYYFKYHKEKGISKDEKNFRKPIYKQLKKSFGAFKLSKVFKIIDKFYNLGDTYSHSIDIPLLFYVYSPYSSIFGIGPKIWRFKFLCGPRIRYYFGIYNKLTKNSDYNDKTYLYHQLYFDFNLRLLYGLKGYGFEFLFGVDMSSILYPIQKDPPNRAENELYQRKRWFDLVLGYIELSWNLLYFVPDKLTKHYPRLYASIPNNKNISSITGKPYKYYQEY